MRRALPSTTLLAIGLLAGCEHDVYVVDITPKGDSFERKLTCWHVGGATTQEEQSEPNITPLSQDKLERLEQVYADGRWSKDGKKRVFIGTFKTRTPKDVGGSGTCTRYTSSLGETVIYTERFRGDDDLAAQLTRRHAAANQLVDLLIGWFRSEVGNEPDFARLHDFLDTNLRQDLKNMVLYIWAGDAVARCGGNAEGEFAARILQYLRERGYVSAKDLPQLVRVLSNAEEQPGPMLSMISRVLARKMGVPEDKPVPECLAFLSDPEHAEASFEAYVVTTDLYKEALEEWEQDESKEPDAKPPEPLGVIGGMVVGELFPIHFFARPDEVRVRLACGTEPFETNGKWDAGTGGVTWEHALATDRSLPAFSYAAWSEPNAETQTKRFGRVILTDQKLAEYVIWYKGLSKPEAAEWDAFLAKCEPNEQLQQRIETFRFPSDPLPNRDEADEERANLADSARELILGGLRVDR